MQGWPRTAWDWLLDRIRLLSLVHYRLLQKNRQKAIKKAILKHPSRQIRPWYTGKPPPDEEVLGIVDRIDPDAPIFYDQGQEDNTGEYADVVKELYSKMDLLKRSPDEFRTWTDEDGYLIFYETLLDFAEAEVKDLFETRCTECHELTEVEVDGASRRVPVNGKTLAVALPPGTQIGLELGMKRFAHDPSLALPW